jgi:hypothetical protein
MNLEFNARQNRAFFNAVEDAQHWKELWGLSSGDSRDVELSDFHGSGDQDKSSHSNPTEPHRISPLTGPNTTNSNSPKNSSVIKFEIGRSLFQVAEQIQNFMASLPNSTEYGYVTLETVEGRYVGQVNGGKPDGLGCVIVPVGKYSGHFVKGIPNGTGSMTACDRKVNGTFSNGVLNGAGDVDIFTFNEMRGILDVRLITLHEKHNKYKGEFKNGNFHGKGKMIYANGDIYEGKWERGSPYGYGRLEYSNGDVYEGEWKDDKMHGKGKIFYRSGAVQKEGTWKQGIYQGNDKLWCTKTTLISLNAFNPHNSLYFLVAEQIKNFVAHFPDDILDGFQKWHTEEGEFEGQISGGKPNGFGKMSVPIGEYEGEFVDGLPSGIGILKTFGGTIESEFLNGIPHGFGTAEVISPEILSQHARYGMLSISNVSGCEIRDKYRGFFKDGKYHGEGRMIYADGSVYDGEWKEGKINTKITYTGGAYEGEWKEGLKQGTGKMIYAEGHILKCEFIHCSAALRPLLMGRMKQTTCSVYDGEWKYNSDFPDDPHQPHGRGKMTFGNGNVYKGEWKEGSLHGKGKMTYVNGDTHEGEWSESYKNGKGVFTSINGHQDIGIWAYNKLQVEVGDEDTRHKYLYV